LDWGEAPWLNFIVLSLVGSGRLGTEKNGCAMASFSKLYPQTALQGTMLGLQAFLRLASLFVVATELSGFQCKAT